MSDVSPTLRANCQRLQRGAFLAGLPCLALCVAAALFLDRTQVFRSYLLAFLFFLGLSLGSLALLMVHHLTGGNWGWAIRRVVEAASCNLWLLALLFIPLLLGLSEVYPWARWTHEEIAHVKTFQQKSLYLNVPWFLTRAVGYFAIWVGFAFTMRLLSRPVIEPSRAESGWLGTLSAPGLILFGITVTFASIDWVMSLEPMWYSSLFGLLFGAGQILSALAFALVVLGLLVPPDELDRWVMPRQRRDLGSLLLTLVMLWAYMAFSQYLLIWAGDLKEETPYYLKRTFGGWRILAILLILLHFALPFVLLLSRDVKHNGRTLGAVAALLLGMRLLDLFWLLVPAFHPYEGFSLHWLDFVAIVGVGGVWLAVFLYHLGQRPMFVMLPTEETGHG